MLADFHPAVAGWFRGTFAGPTEAQVAAWPAIRAGRHTLVAAPTGSGKTLTAFLAALDALVRQGLMPLAALARFRPDHGMPLSGLRALLVTLEGAPDAG